MGGDSWVIIDFSNENLDPPETNVYNFFQLMIKNIGGQQNEIDYIKYLGWIYS